MRCRIPAARLLLVASAALVTLCCGHSKQSSQPGIGDRVEALEDSGRRLSGEFLLAEVEDEYRANGAQARRQTVLSFDESGQFKRQDDSRIEEGGYLMTASGDLVIYVEKINGDFLTSARLERYIIVDQTDDTIELRGPSRSLILQKR